MLSASGPYEGHLVRPSDHKEPEKIAWLQCVGSRDINCSAITAIAPRGVLHVHQQADRHRQGAQRQTTGYGGLLHGYAYLRQGFRALLHALPRMNTACASCAPRCIPSIRPKMTTCACAMSPKTANRGRSLRHGGALGRPGPQQGVRPPGQNHWHRAQSPACRHQRPGPGGSNKEGVFVCGAFQEPKDIPQSVMEASAAASPRPPGRWLRPGAR
jgi:hypothetical protein